jgi:hypothetical protein
MKSYISMLLALLAIAFLCGCEETEDGQSTEVGQSTEEAQPTEDSTTARLLSFNIVDTHDFLGSPSFVWSPTETVIRSQREWEELWLPATAPSVDVPFDNQMLIVVGLGSRRTGGYSVTVESITLQNDSILVEYVETAHSGDVTMAITAPFQVVKAERHDVSISFRKSTRSTGEEFLLEGDDDE